MRFGLLGTGPWAEMVHGPALAANEGVELVGVWGRDPAKAGALAKRLDTTAYSDRRQLYDEVEAIAFCLPPSVQASFSIEAARAGCHLLLEKPLALTAKEAEAVDEEVRKAGVAALIFYTALYDPELTTFFSELGVGSWLTAEVVILSTIFDGKSPFGDSPWRQERGALWDIGPHSLAWASAALGLPQKASATRGIGDLVHMNVTHESGATSAHLLSLTAPAEAGCTRATFFGESGVLLMPEKTESSLVCFKVAIDQLMETARARTQHPLGTTHGLAVVRALEETEASL
ncbi:MAG: Gfo/Idh/MocA family protein [Acidimicrobiales bacterium]